MGKILNIAAPDGAIPTYVASPADPAGATATIVVVHEIYGLNDGVRRVADSYAAAGFTALAPDLLWRIAPGRVYGYDEREAAIVAVRALPDEAIVGDLRNVLRWQRQRGDGQQPLGLLSLGWGGWYAFIAAQHEPVDALVAYYPGNIGRVSDPAGVQSPVLIHFGALDPITPPELVERIRAAFAARTDASIVVHADAGHGFANRDRNEFHAASADAADAHSLAFLQQAFSRPHLVSSTS